MFHSFWRLLAHTIRSSGSARSAVRRRQAHPQLEALEDRSLPNATTIAGFVYADTNNNGVMDANETGLANSTIELHRATGELIDTTTSDANGHYLFNNDPTIVVGPQVKEEQADFDTQTTNWTRTEDVDQFDPSLGTLTSVEIVQNANLHTHVKVENAESRVTDVGVEVGGTFALSGAGFGSLVNSVAKIQNQTSLQPFDGTTDYAGPSSFDFGQKDASASGSTVLTAAANDLSAFVGKGKIRLTESAEVSSNDTGSGNFDKSIRSQADGHVKLIFHYIPSTGLKPGDYVVKQITDIPDYFDGQDTGDNKTPIPNSYNTDIITVHLDGNNDSPSNNFGEVPPASIAGHVYHDVNANGIRDGGEEGLGGVMITLTGTDVLGHVVNLNTTTNADGSYSFKNLWSGSDYTLTETTQPNGYLTGAVTVGSQGGAVGFTAIVQINLGTVVNGVNNDFGHVLPSSVAGFVYEDPNNNGVKEAGELPILSVSVTLTGLDDQGNQVFQTQETKADGSYSFANLRPGFYTISEAQPPGFLNGLSTPGSLGGTAGNDQLFVNLGENKQGLNYNFGELRLDEPPPPPPPPLTPKAPPGDPINPVPPVDPPFGKWWFLS